MSHCQSMNEQLSCKVNKKEENKIYLVFLVQVVKSYEEKIKKVKFKILFTCVSDESKRILATFLASKSKKKEKKKKKKDK